MQLQTTLIRLGAASRPQPEKRSKIVITIARATLIGAAILATATLAAEAQPYPYYQAPPAASLPQSWSYDPYTSGAAPCPQGIPGDLQRCAQKMPPSYGQPNYWGPGR